MADLKRKARPADKTERANCFFNDDNAIWRLRRAAYYIFRA